jgi:hypothetical protein
MSHGWTRALCSLMVVALAPTTAFAQVAVAPEGAAEASAPAAPPVIVDVVPSAAMAPAEVIRSQIAQELRAPALAPATPIAASSPRGTLLIFVTPDRRLTVRWSAASGAQLERSVPAPSDPIEFVRTIGVLAANLAQDPLAELGLPVQQSAPAPVQVNIALQPMAVAPVQVQPAPVAPPPVVVAAPPVVVQQPEDWRARRARQTVTFGMESYASASSDRSSVVSIGSLFVNAHVRPWLRVGVSQITGGPLASGGGGYASASPYAEFVWAPLQWFEGFAQVGLGLQGRFTNNHPRPPVGSSGAIGYGSSEFAMDASATVGARFRIGHVFSLGLGLRAASSVVNDFHYGHTSRSSATSGSMVGAGMEIGWTIGG